MKCKTVATVLVSLAVGALLYHVVYLFLTPNLKSQAWRLDAVVSEQNQRNVFLNSKARNVSFKHHEKIIPSNGSRKPLTISEPFHLPQPHFSKPTGVVLHSEWVSSLQQHLSSVKGTQISVVTSSIEHTDVLLNWLIAAHLVAKPPIHNVLVLTLDSNLKELLRKRGFSSLYVNPEWIINPKAKVSRVFSQVHIVRLAVVRVINNYGFDVVNYDCDAITLKNPQVIFDSHKDADLIGTFGKGPYHLFKKWGVTLNTGVMLLRANKKIEHYWEVMSRMKNPVTDDQGNINKALEALHLKWINFEPSENIDNIVRDIYGAVHIRSLYPFNMSVMLMSFSTVCRQTCTREKKDEYYVWHSVAIKENRTVENKIKQARVGDAWFLSEQWLTVSEQNVNIVGVEWLMIIADKGILRVRTQV